MSSRGHLGGLSAATPQAVRVLEAPAATRSSSRPSASARPRSRSPGSPTPRWCCSRPGMGDAIQAAKAGVLEIADIFVVNKADRDGADATYRDIQGMIGARRAGARPVATAVLRTVAARAEGIDELVAAIDKHRAYLSDTGELQPPPASGGPRPRSRRSPWARCVPGWRPARTAPCCRPCRRRGGRAGTAHPTAGGRWPCRSERPLRSAGQPSARPAPGGTLDGLDRHAARHPIPGRPVVRGLPPRRHGDHGGRARPGVQPSRAAVRAHRRPVRRVHRRDRADRRGEGHRRQRRRSRTSPRSGWP